MIKKVKKFIPEIIAGIVIVAIIVGLVLVTKKLHSNSVHDGNYIGGNSTEEAVELDVKWLPALEEVEGIKEIQFSEKSNFKSYEQKEILEREGWYLLNFNVQVNNEYGYFEKSRENILVPDVWTWSYDDVFVFTVEDGIGTICKVDEFWYETHDGYNSSTLTCKIYFSNNGACFDMSDSDVSVEIIYLEKNGELTAYTYQIIQSILIGAMTIVGLAYMIFAYKKKRIIPIAVVFGVIFFTFLLMKLEVRNDSDCEWRNKENEKYLVIFPESEEWYIRIEGDCEGHLGRRIGEEFSEEFDPSDKDFREDYKCFDIIPGYRYYPYVLCVDLLVGAICIIFGYSSKKKNNEAFFTGVGSGWILPFGEYDIARIVYFSDAFKGMEEYMMQNLGESKIKFLQTYFAFDDIEIENPEYKEECHKISIYKGIAEEKVHEITILDGVDYDICVAKKGMYLRKKMADEVIMVYEIKTQEG